MKKTLTVLATVCFFSLFVSLTGGAYGADKDLAVQKVKPGNLTGVVQDASGKKLANAKVQVLNSKGDVVCETTSNKHGLYRIEKLPEGEYTLQVGKTSIAKLSVSKDAAISSFMVVMPATPIAPGMLNWSLIAAGGAVIAVGVPVISHNSGDSSHHPVSP